MSNTTTARTYFWIAINGASCAISSIPWPVTVAVKPTPEYLLGFPTFSEARDTQQFMLTAPIPEVRKRLEGFRDRVRRGEIIHIDSDSPEPPTRRPTMWSNSGEVLKSVEVIEVVESTNDEGIVVEGQARVSAINTNGDCN